MTTLQTTPDAGPNCSPPASLSPASDSAVVARLVPRAIDPVSARVSQTLCDVRLATLVETLGNIQLRDTRPFDGSGDEAAVFHSPAVIEITLEPDGVIPAPIFVLFDLDAYPALSIAAGSEQGSLTALMPGVAEAALRQAVARVLLEPLAARLTRLGLGVPRIVSVMRRSLSDCAAAVPFDAPAVALSLSCAGERIDCIVRTTTATLALLDGRIEAMPPPEWRNRLSRLELPGSAILGRRTYAAGTLAALEPGDVLLRCLFPSLSAEWTAPGESAPAPASIVAAWGARGHVRIHVPAALDRQSIHVSQEPFMTDELGAMPSDPSRIAPTDAAPVSLGRVELPVQFEIDTVALPIEQLASLGPGYVVELPIRAADAQLRLVVHGQTVGFGELVTVGEQLGVRIVRMAHRHASTQ